MAGDYSLSLSQRRKPSDGHQNGFSSGRISPDRAARSAPAADNFLKAFEKPTQIYRYMTTRSSKVSFLLHRNLSYMKTRMSRTNQRRKAFKIDEMMDRFLSEIEAQAMRDRQDLILIFKSIEDPHFVAGGEPGSAIIAASIICVHSNPSSRREQEVRTELMSMEKEVLITSGSCSPFNVRMQIDKGTFPKMSKSFIKCLLVITVRLNHAGIQTGRGHVSPDSKRRKRAELSTSGHTRGPVYSSEIMIFNSRMERKLLTGKYEIVLKLEPVSSKTELDSHAQVKMEVVWSDPPVPFVRTSNGFGKYEQSDKQLPNEGLTDDITIYYQFLTNNECQETRTKLQNLLCPWCNVNCLLLKSLAAHLKNMHPRLNFRLRSEIRGTRTEVHVEVSPNELFDGSYSGNPQDLSFTASRTSQGPMRRTPFTVVLVNKKTDGHAALMDGDDDDSDQLRPTIHGHDRLYYHTNTCIPIRPQDMEIDSEDENDPQWMRYKTQQMLDEFTDVNDGEKEVMKLWNLHIMKYGFTGDCQIPEACRIFLEERGDVLREKNLRFNFILHLISLYDYGLIDAVEKANLIKKLNQIFNRSYPIVSNGHSVLSQTNGSKDDKGCRLS